MTPSVTHLLKQVESAGKKTDRQSSLIDICNRYPAIPEILKLALTPNVKFSLPEVVVYDHVHLGDNLDTQLHYFAKKLWKFTNEVDIPDEVKRIKFFRKVLEAVCEEDCNLILAIKAKKFPFKNITFKFVQETLPGLIDNGQVTA